MGVGEFGKLKIGAIIQARFDSTRLPGKVLKTLPFGSDETVLSQINNRLVQVKEIDEVIVATSEENNDTILKEYCDKKQIICERGSKNDVLGRYVKVTKQRKLDVVVRITGDNPVVLIDIVKKAIQKHIEGKYDYTRNNNLPYGTSFEIVNANVLNSIYNKKLTEEDKEHVTIFIKKNKNQFNILEIDHHLPLLDFRFTVDYPSDYAIMNILFQYLKSLDYQYNFDNLNTFVNDNLWLKSVNENNIQKKQYNSFSEEVKDAINILGKYELKNVANYLKKI